MLPRLQKFLPIVLIALAVQILAPVVACWAAGAIASDPLQGVGICHDSGSAGADGQSGDPRAHAGCCALCCLTHAGGPTDTPRSISVVALFRHAKPVIWPDATVDTSRHHTGSNTQARAPPQLT